MRNKVAKLIRAVLDTNVFVAAALSKNPTSPTKEILKRWQRGEFVLLICTTLAQEVVEKLLDRDIDEAEVVKLVDLLDQLAEWVEVPANKIEYLLVDPDDNIVISCAVEGQANYLITYDPHFDSLNGEYRGVKILKAIPFLTALRSKVDL